MKKWLMVVVLLFLLVPKTVAAENVKTKEVTINVTSADTTEKAENLHLYAAEAVGSLYAEGAELDAEFQAKDGSFFATLTLPVGYKYRVQGATGEATIDTSAYEYSTEPRIEIGVALGQMETSSGGAGASHKESAGTSATNEVVTYTLEELYNETGKLAENFSFHVTLPEGSRIEKFYSGTYTQECELSLSYKERGTNLWKIADEHISSTTAKTIDFSTLTEGGEISEIIFSAATVPSGFQMKKEDPLYYTVRVLSEAQSGQKLDVKSNFSSYIDSVKTGNSEQRPLILVDGVKTGDGNILYVISLIGMIGSVVLILAYFVFLLIQKRQASRPDVVVREAKDYGGKTMADFM